MDETRRRIIEHQCQRAVTEALTMNDQRSQVAFLMTWLAGMVEADDIEADSTTRAILGLSPSAREATKDASVSLVNDGETQID